jgi:putative beta-lysine N-acetyltransferase
VQETLRELDRLARDFDYSKIFAKVPESCREAFKQHGYLPEAAIPDFFRDGEAVYFMSRFLKARRVDDPHAPEVEKIRQECEQVEVRPHPATVPESFTCRPARDEDVEAMVALFGKVFATYPFPIHDPAYVRKTMQEHIHYFTVWDGPRLVAESSAETDAHSGAAELTDFATDPDYRGRGLASCLLSGMEDLMRREGFQTMYTIARAVSMGMNRTFARQGYLFGGTLVNNTNICGAIESMNIWYKHLKDEA